MILAALLLFEQRVFLFSSPIVSALSEAVWCSQTNTAVVSASVR